jgi:NAD(P)-dependent dehydrogenase (short-subunit alcohol dehydrogenase family)
VLIADIGHEHLTQGATSMTSLLQGKVSLVTGAGAGIGRASALAFAREGAKVIVSDVNDKGGHETVSMIESKGGSAFFIHADVAKAGDVEKLVGGAVQKYGRLDCAFNNAGIEGVLAPTNECTDENFDRIIATNLKGVWLCMRYELNQMLEQGGGAIVNMSSVAGLIGFAGLPAYVASKHGVVGLTKTAALEFASKNIRVNTVCPGVIHTEMIDRLTHKEPAQEKAFTSLEPMGRMGKPEEVGEAAVWLCSPAASFVTGIAMAIDGGFVAQ